MNKTCDGCAPILISLPSIEIPDIPSASSHTIIKQKPGPKAWDVNAYMHGKIPAFTEAACEERLAYLLTSPDVFHACLGGESVAQKIAACFTHLWGSNAPERFRSIVKYHKDLYELQYIDTDTGEPLLYHTYASIKEFMNCTYVELFFDFLETMCHAPELLDIPAAQHILETIQAHPGEIFTLQEAIQSTSDFQKQRHKVPELNAKAKQTRTALRNAIETCTPHTS